MAEASVAKYDINEVWRRAEMAQKEPHNDIEKRFSEYPLVDRDIQFGAKEVPAGRWFIDWGLPRERYGSYEVIQLMGICNKPCRTKLAKALCPKCLSPIFSIFLTDNNRGLHARTRQLCLVCGYSEEIEY